MANKESKYSYFDEDEDLQRWLRNIKRGSPANADIVKRQLGRICEWLSTTPRGMIDLATSDMKRFQDSLEDLVAKLEDEKKSPGYITTLLKAVRSWLRYNNITLIRRIKVTNPNATPTIENEQVPTQAELARALRTSPPRIRVAEVLMAFADLRPESIGNYDGSDGLMLKDLPELNIDDGKITFEKIPTMVMVRSTLSKTRNKYFTFLSEEGCNYLKEYLEERIRNGEELAPETPLIGHDRPGAAEKEFMMTRVITHFIRKYMRAAGVRKRPYVLRAYAETQLIIAESKGKISHPYLQFIAGHKGDIESRYSTNKGKLPPDMIEGMRTQYKACEPFLSTTSKLEQSAVVKEAQIEALKSIAKNLLGLDLLEVKIAKEKELEKELNPKEELGLYENEIKKLRINPQKMRDEGDFENKLVAEKELENYLNNGWEMVQTINSKILVRKKA